MATQRNADHTQPSQMRPLDEGATERRLAEQLAHPSRNADDQAYGIKLLERTAHRGDPLACKALAIRHISGEGAVYDPRRAARWIDTAIRLSGHDLEAQGELWAMLGAMHSEGKHPEANAHRAVECFERSGECGFGKGWAAAGTLLIMRPELVHEPEARIVECFERGVAASSPEAMHQMGIWRWGGHGPVPADKREGLKLLRGAANAGERRAQTDLGIALCEHAKETGPKNARRAREEAIQWFHRAASKGEAAAAFNLGSCLEKGWGAPADSAKARAAYGYGAKLGDAEAWRALARMLETGVGGEADPKEAVRCLHTAALEGSICAREEIASRYESGEAGIGADPVQSLTWSRMTCTPNATNEEELSAQKQARERNARISALLTPEDRQRSDNLLTQAREWTEKKAQVKPRNEGTVTNKGNERRSAPNKQGPDR